MTWLIVQHGDIRFAHVSCVMLSGGVFLSCGLMRIADAPTANHRALRVSSYVIDSALLTAGILLTLIVRQYPLTNGWLTTKVLLVLVYIALGLYALKRAKRQSMRVMAYFAALMTYAFSVGVAIAHRPAG